MGQELEGVEYQAESFSSQSSFPPGMEILGGGEIIPAVIQKYTSTPEECGKEITFLKGQISLSSESLGTDSWALKAPVEVTLDTCRMECRFFLEMVPDSHSRVKMDRFPPPAPHVHPGSRRRSRCNHQTLSMILNME